MPETQLFHRWLEQTRILQIEAYGRDPGELEGAELIEYIRWNYIAAIKELGEMLDEVGWKPWATSRHVNTDAAAGEVVDVMHFMGNLLLAFGWDDEKLDAAYIRKMIKNRERQESGIYDGITGKCPSCKRALDDENTLCTETECANA